MIKVLGSLICLVALAFPVLGQTLYIPQVVDGANWQTTFVLTNTTGNSANVSMSFEADSSAGNTTPWSPPFLEVNSTANLVLSGGSTMYLHTPGTAVNLTEGYALVTADAGVVVSAIFTIRNPGKQDVEGTSIATASTTRVLVPFDNTSGNVTSVGIVNPTGVAQTVSVNFKTASGTVVQGTLPSVPANGHMAFTLPQQFPAIAGQDGLAEFYVTSGTISLLALQFTSSGAFTASPVYFESGPPIITGSTSGGGQVLNGQSFVVNGTLRLGSNNLNIEIQAVGSSPTSYFIAIDNTAQVGFPQQIILALSNLASNAGNTATFNTVSTGLYEDTSNMFQPLILPITSSTLSLTFTTLSAGSSVNGSLTFTGSGTTLSGTITGSIQSAGF